MSEIDDIKAMYRSDMTKSNPREDLEKLKELRKIAVEVNTETKQSSVNEMDTLRKVYADMLGEPAKTTDFATFPDGTRANDKDLPKENRGIRR